MSQTLPAIDTASALDTLLRTNKVYSNLRSGPLVEQAVRKDEGHLADNGAFAAFTGKYTGRAPKDRLVVKDSVTSDKVNWGEVNQPFDSAKFDSFFEHVIEHVRGRDLFIQDLYCGADPTYRLPIRV